jgi:hypothetical protein
MVDLMGETMSEAQATAMLEEAVRRTKALVEAEKIPEWAAAQRVANQMKQEQKMLGALVKRQVAMDAGARFQLREIAKTGKKSTWAKNVQTFLQKIEDTANAIGSRHVAGFLSDLRERSALDGWLDKKNHLAIWQELEQLNFQRLGLDSKVGYTGNKQAQAIAEVFFNRRMDIQATNNRWGAHTEEVPGYMFLQSHSSEKLKLAGMSPRFKMKVFGKESFAESYRVWRQSMDALNIDWGRTLAGEDREKFLKNFHSAIYTNIHGGQMEEGVEGRKFKKPGGSLAEKLSSQRLLWFADAESAYKYNEQWGVQDTAQSIIATLRTGARNQAMLMNLGTRPVDNVELVREKLLKDVREERPDDAGAQEKDLHGNRITGQMNLLTGKANVSSKPWLSDAVDFLKNITITGKGGSIILTAFSDKAFARARMTFEGLSSLEATADQLRTLLGVRPELAAELGIYNHSLAGGNQTRWDGEFRPVLFSHKLLEWTMKYQGMNRWTASNQASMGLVVAKKLATDSHLPWDALDARRKQVLTEYGFSPKEWEAIRTAKYTWGDEWQVITPNKMQELPDAVVAKLIDGKPTAAAIRRVKDELEAKLDFYIFDAMNEGVPTPTASVRSIRTLNGTQRGEWSREFAELAFVFKGFPIKAAMTMARQSKSIGGVGGAFHALSLVAQAGALGYLSGIAKDTLRGRTPKRLIEFNGDGSFKQLNTNVWLDSVLKGGGLGIYGDLLLSDYDRRYRGALEIAAGPVLGEMANTLNLFGKSRRVAMGEESVEGLGYEILRTVENNAPLVGMFPIKSIMEYLVMWQLKEALSPGVFRRTQRSVENHNHQEYWIEPVR